MTTPIDQLTEAAKRAPDARFHWGAASCSYAELLDRSLRCARGLDRLGIGAGDRVAFWLPNSLAYLELFFACLHIGAIAVAVNTRFRTAEAESILSRTATKALVVWPQFKDIAFAELLAAMDPAALKALESVIVYGGDWPAEILAGKRVVRHDDLRNEEPLASRAAPEFDCAIFATSGTTSAPKFAVHRQGVVARHAAMTAAVCGYDRPGTHLLQAIPFCGIFGFSQMIATVAGAASATLLDVFEPVEAGRLVRERGIHHVNGTDDLLKRLLDVYPTEERPYPSLRHCVYAAFNPTLADFPTEAERRGMHLIGAFGMTEVFSFVSLQPYDASLDVRATSGGRLVNPAAKVRARSRETGEVLLPGEVGELEIGSDTLFRSYFRDPDATRAAFTEDGYFRTGDLGFTRDDGTFRFLGRAGDFLRLGGFLVNPLEIEHVLQQDAAIETAVVVEVATEHGNKAVAFVRLRSGHAFDGNVVRGQLKAVMADFKIPARFIVVTAFPVAQGPNGEKIQRLKLKVMAADAIAATA
jgi:fatty-acyl-CoA synthase